MVITYVEQLVAQNSSVAYVLKEVDAVCALLPSPGSGLCTSIAAQYVPQMVQWILNKENPQTFCSQVGLCSSSNNIQQNQQVKRNLVEVEGLQFESEETQGACPLCEMVITYVEQLVAQNSSEAYVLKEVDAVCDMLPSPGSGLCTSIAAQYVPQMIQWILNKENPQNFCTQVGLCSSKINTLIAEYKRNEDQGTCPLCTMIISYVEQLVAQNSTLSFVLKEVDKVCALLPSGPTIKLCDQIAATYVPGMVKWILKKEDPDQFCAQVHLC